MSINRHNEVEELMNDTWSSSWIHPQSEPEKMKKVKPHYAKVPGTEQAANDGADEK